MLQAGQFTHAAALLGESITMFDASFARDQQIYLIHLADALSRPGRQRDLEAAAALGVAALRLVATPASARGIACLRELYGQMQPHASVPAVHDFLEQTQSLLAT